MSQFTIHFSHANGFPASTYRKFLGYLEKKFTVSYAEMLGHNPNYPVTNNWHYLVDELIAELLQRYDYPVIGIGHSFGGVLTYLACIKRPELFKAVVLLDSPIFGYFKSKMLRLSKRFGFIDKLTPAHRAQRRRNFFSDMEEAYNYFLSKKLFQQFDSDCLRDYVTQGMEKTTKGLALKFSPQIEYQIFRTLPDHLPQLKVKLQVPGGFLYGEKSDILTFADIKKMNEKYNLIVQHTKGGHLFPFEFPYDSAEDVVDLVKRLVNPITL